MPRGRRPRPVSEEERARLRRERVRLNVQNFRRRQAGLKNADSEAKPALRWIEATKWQDSYGRQSGTNSEASGSPSKSISSPTTTTYATKDEKSIEEEVVVRRIPPVELMSPNLSKQELYAMLSTFPARFLPTRISLPSIHRTEEIRTPCAFWVTSAYSLALQDGPGFLSDILLALTTALAGAEYARNDLGVLSRRFYQRSLQSIRKQLYPVINENKCLASSDTEALLLACHAASIFEVYVNKSFDDMSSHIRGIGTLINHQFKFTKVQSPVGLNLLEEYRMIDLSTSLLERRETAFSPTVQLTAPSTQLAQNNKPELGLNGSIFTAILDIAEQIPSIMVEIDYLKLSPRTDECDKQINRLIRILLKLQSQLEHWSRYLHFKCDSGESPRSDDSLGMPDNEIDVSKIHSYDYACSWMFCLSYEIFALAEITAASELLKENSEMNAWQAPQARRITTYKVGLLRTKLVDSAGKLAQLMAYFFQDSQGVIGRSLALWPLEACWAALENECVRIRNETTRIGSAKVDNEFLEGSNRKKSVIQKYLNLCRDRVKVARSYGLPVMNNRG